MASESQEKFVITPHLDIKIITRSSKVHATLQANNLLCVAARSLPHALSFHEKLTPEIRTNWQPNQRILIIDVLQDEQEPLSRYAALQAEATAKGAEVHILPVHSTNPIETIEWITDQTIRKLRAIHVKNDALAQQRPLQN